jgi:predicted DNA-binding transcriptional regulator AlpA
MGRQHSDGADGEFSDVKFLSYSDLEERYGKSRVTLWRWARAGLLPAPYETGPNSVGFRSDEIKERDAKLKRKTYGQES